jgi:uncharacterized protein (TIGR01777 family)
MKILVSGSTGLIGSALIPFLEEKGHEVFKLVRGHTDLLPHEIAWDSVQGMIHPSLLEGMDAVVHLAGENIMGRWTEAKKAKIRTSRVEGTKLLCQVLCALKSPPSVFIGASAIGYYGDRGDEILTEQSAQGKGFLAEVCGEWEESTRMVRERGMRTLNLRIGMVLSAKGGALKHMLPIFKWGMGGRMGKGNQWMSWVAIDDLIATIDFALHQQKMSGPLNVVSPFPVTNQTFTETLGRLLHRPVFMAMPAFEVKWVFGQLGIEVLLSSERVQPAKLEEAGFVFAYPHLEEALRGILYL